jgi:DNA replication protein DnaC
MEKVGDTNLLRRWPKKPPAWLLPDDPNMCRRCLDCGVVVREFRTVEEYCRHYGVAAADLAPEERRQLASYERRRQPIRMASPCGCASQKRREGIVARAVRGLPRELAAASFAGVHLHVPYKREAARQAEAFAAHVAAGGGGALFFAGETGTGKTYLAVATLRAAAEGGASATLLSSAELCDELRRRAFDVAELRAYVARVRAHDLVIIDDFGSERLGPSEGAVLDHYGRLLKSFESGGALLVTTNYDFQEALVKNFGDEGDRLARRLGGVQFCRQLLFGRLVPAATAPR